MCALYTSFYARQLALRPEALGEQQTVEDGEKTLQKAVARRTVDCTGPFITWFEKRLLVRNPADAPGMQATPVGALGLLPPVAYAHQPAASFTVKLAAQAPSKTRSSVNVAVWTPEGRRCLTGTQAGEFCLWGGQSFQFETIIQAHETPVRTMVFTHSGNFLVSGDESGSLRYWRPNLELVKSFPGHREAVRQAAFAPTDLKFATASDDSTVRVWDFARVTTEQVLAGHGGDVKTVAWHPSKALLASGSKDALVKLWCARSGRAVGTLHGHKGTITATQWASNGNWVLTAARDQVAKVWDVRMQAEVASFIGHAKDLTQAAWHPLHEGLFVTGAHDGSLCFWVMGRQGPQAEVRAAHEGPVWATSWHPSGHLLVTGAGDAATRFWSRSRPGDPFMEEQHYREAELAAMAGAEAAPAARPQAPALYVPSQAAGGGGGAAIPGIGEGVVAVQPAAAADTWAAAPAGAVEGYYGGGGFDAGAGYGGGEAGGAPPRRGGWQEDGGERRRVKRSRDRSRERGWERDRSRERERPGERPHAGGWGQEQRRTPPPRSRRGDPDRERRDEGRGWRERGPEPPYATPRHPAPQYQEPPRSQYQEPYQQQYQQYGAPPPGDVRYSAPPPAAYGGRPAPAPMQPQYGAPPPQHPYYGGPPPAFDAGYMGQPPPGAAGGYPPAQPPPYPYPPPQQPAPYGYQQQPPPYQPPHR